MSSSKIKERKRPRFADDIYDRITRSGPSLNFYELKRPESLCPGESTAWGFVCGDPHAVAIIRAWQFHFPVRVERLLCP
jgi:hypothetical protein